MRGNTIRDVRPDPSGARSAPALGRLAGRAGARLRRRASPRRPPAAPRRSPAAPPKARTSPSARLRSAGASWYGPGLCGNKTACGQTLRPTTIGVAHEDLPCGTMVKFVYHGHAVDHPGDRPRPLRQRPRLGPDRRRQRSARLRTASAWSATRSPSSYARAGAPEPLEPLPAAFSAAPAANLPCSGSASFNERSSVYVEVFARSSRRGTPRRGRWLTLALAVGSPRDRVAPRRRRQRRQGRPAPTVVLGQTSTVPDPSCPGCPARRSAASPASRSATARPARPSCVPHDGTIKAWTLTLAQPTNKQRSFFNGFFGTPPEARLAILRRVPGTNPPRYNLRSQGSIKVLTPLPRPDGQVRLLPGGRKGRHRRHHRPDLGPGLRPGPARQQRLARQPRTRHLHQLHRHPPGRTAGKGRQPRHLRLQVLDGPPALHGDPGRGN